MHFKAAFSVSWLLASLFTSQMAMYPTDPSLPEAETRREKRRQEHKGSKSPPTRSPTKLGGVSISTEVLKCEPNPGSLGLCALWASCQGKGSLLSEGVEVRKNTLEDIGF